MLKSGFDAGVLLAGLSEFCRTRPEEAALVLIVVAVGFLLSSVIFARRIIRLRRICRSLREEVAALESSLMENSVTSTERSASVECASPDSPVGHPVESQVMLGEPPSEADSVEELEEPEDRTPPSIDSAKSNEQRVSAGPQKTRSGFLSRLASFFASKNAIDSSMMDDLEELLILSDVGARCAGDLVEQISKDLQSDAVTVTRNELEQRLMQLISVRLNAPSKEDGVFFPSRECEVFLIVGVNGVGKTTTVAKLASKYVKQGKMVMAIAADTFRAAAVQQLEEWSSRIGFEVFKGAEGAKPGAVVFDGIVRAKDENFDVVLIDTAGRLHTKSNLMQELQGVKNSITRHLPDAPHETILVVDGVSGQNALVQAREFNNATKLTGLIVTKLDGTPKGGIIVAISDELNLPVFYIGVGEKAEDLVPFVPSEFVSSLFCEQTDIKSRLPDVAINS